jgi:hypothetical protein
MAAQPQVPSTRVVTGVVRCSYVYVHEPKKNIETGKDEYAMAILVPKTDRETIAKLRAARDAAAAAKWGSKLPAGLQSPIHDGDGAKPNGGDYGEECKGHYVINVKSSQRPGLVDAALNPVLNREDFQSGDYARVSLNAYAYDKKRLGVAFGLNNIQVVRKGDSLTGRARAEDDFDTFGGGDSFEGTGADTPVPTGAPTPAPW